MRMRWMVAPLAVIVVLACADDSTTIIGGCSDAFTGITETDATGATTGAVDSDDWQSNGDLAGMLAFPNPADGPCHIAYDVLDSLGLEISIQIRPGYVVWNTDVTGLQPGARMISWDLTDNSGKPLPDCTYRVVLKTTSPAGTEYAHGDIRIKH